MDCGIMDWILQQEKDISMMLVGQLITVVSIHTSDAYVKIQGKVVIYNSLST